jgi:DNA-binding response OmpR family regulator
MLVELTLRTEGLEVVSFLQGSEGLKALAESRFNLVILDVMMPDMSGYEVLQHMKDMQRTDLPPVALFTARPEDAEAHKAKAHGVVQILPKPFEPDQMVRAVKALLRN